MKHFPFLRPQARQQLLTAYFSGYDHHATAKDGAFWDTKNLTTERYPMLTVRKKRGVVDTLAAPGGLLEKDALAVVDNGTLYYNGSATAVTGLSAGEKQLVSMGAYLCIFPDKVYYNTENGTDYGSMEASYSSTQDANIVYSLCRSDGTDYTVQVGGDEPDAGSVDVWITNENGTTIAMSYSASYGSWVQLDTVYTKLTFTTHGDVPRLFKEGDGVTISGSDFADANGEKVLYALGGSGTAGSEEDDWIVVVGLLSSSMTQTTGKVTITRTVPTMDYVCEAQNRLWGCYYGASGGVTLNEIYCCALGDFKNWRQYRGLSTDSWTASVGSDGQWTGAVNYLGSPVFFKENRIHEVGVSSVGAHTVRETVCRGVQKGSWKSLIVVNETLFYKSRTDVCAWQGGFPQGVSEALGEESYYSAAAGAFGGRYYLSMKDGGNVWHLFVYDIAKGLWMREDNLHVLQFAKVDDELYAIDGTPYEIEPEDPEEDPVEYYRLLALNGTEGTLEGDLEWYAETGLQLAVPYADPKGFGGRYSRDQNKKYLSRYDIRLHMDEGAEATVYLQYDSDGAWIESGSVALDGIGTVTLPVRPRRCDHLRMKITGTGHADILSLARVLEVGSDM